MNSNNQQGKRQKGTDSLWQRYRSWLAGMTRNQRIRYRCIQAAAVLAVLIIAVFLILRSWVRVPEVPDFPQPPVQSGGMIDGSTSQSVNSGITFDGAEVPDVARSGRREGVYTFLVVGRDVVSGATDTILLLTYNTQAKTIQGLNIPRDTMINTSATSKRINSVYARNRGSRELEESARVKQGMDALKLQVGKLTGIIPDFYVIVEWDAVGRLVDALGGVEFEVPWDMNYDDPEQNLHIHQKAGLRLLDGEDAMEVVRWRKNNSGRSPGDVGRLAVQQDFLKAVAKKCLQPATFLKVPDLAQIFSENVETDLSVGNILAFAQQAYGMDPDTGVSFSTAPLAANFRYGGADMVTLNSSELLEVLNNGMNPYLRDIQVSDLELLYRNSNGSFGVTKGTLADSKMAQPAASSTGSASQSNKEDEDEDPDSSEIDEGEDPDSSKTGNQTGTQTGNQSGTQTGDQTGVQTSDPGKEETPSDTPEEGDPKASGSEQENPSSQNPLDIDIDTSQIFPDPNAGSIPDTSSTHSTDELTEPTEQDVLPENPETVGAVA